MARASKDLAREHTRAGVLRLAGLRGPIPRNAIARELGVSPATVTSLSRELLDMGLLEAVGKVPSDGGRPAELLQLAADSAHLVGAKATSGEVIGVISDLRGRVVASFREPFDASGTDPISGLETILRRHIGQADGVLLGIGLGVPGLVDTAGGGRVNAPSLGWRDLLVGEDLQARLDAPVIVENDVHTLAVAERLYGRAQDVDDFLTVTIGRGIGLGITLGGQLHRGARGGAGELGHTRAVEDGPACDCGRRGCLEAVAAEPALVRAAEDSGVVAEGAGIEALRAAARAGERGALELFRAAGGHLGGAIADTVNLLAPELVLISGEGIASWPHMGEAFDEAYADGVLTAHGEVPFAVDPWEDLDWARGAVSLLFRSVFTPSAGDRGVERLVRSRLTSSLELGEAAGGR